MRYQKTKITLLSAFSLLLLLTGCAGTMNAARGTYATRVGEYHYVEGNYEKALVRFKEAAAHNNPYACYRLYVMYLYGQGTAKNPRESTIMLEKAAKLGDETSQVIYGSRLIFGAPSQRPTGVALLKAAADRENRYAYEYLAMAYENGLGVKKSAEQARKYQRLARSQGSATPTNKSGSTGAASSTDDAQLTRSIQTELKRLGYYRGKVDGLSGPMTREAIASFQKERGYPVKPEISGEVLAELRKD